MGDMKPDTRDRGSQIGSASRIPSGALSLGMAQAELSPCAPWSFPKPRAWQRPVRRSPTPDQTEEHGRKCRWVLGQGGLLGRGRPKVRRPRPLTPRPGGRRRRRTRTGTEAAWWAREAGRARTTAFAFQVRTGPSTQPLRRAPAGRDALLAPARHAAERAAGFTASDVWAPKLSQVSGSCGHQGCPFCAEPGGPALALVRGSVPARQPEVRGDPRTLGVGGGKVG